MYMKKDDVEKLVQKQIWFNLKEVCLLKNLNYKTACNQKQTLQPNQGVPDAMIGGRKMWNRSTVLGWILQSDEELADNSQGADDDRKI